MGRMCTTTITLLRADPSVGRQLDSPRGAGETGASMSDGPDVAETDELRFGLEVTLLNVPPTIDGWNRPWPFAELPSVVVNPTAGEPLHQMLDQAMEQLESVCDVVYDPRREGLGYFVASYHPELQADALLAWPNFAYGPIYGVREDGTLVIDDHSLAVITVGDLVRAASDGYRSGDWRRLLVVPPEGLGGGDFSVPDLLRFLDDIGVIAVSAAGIWRGGRWGAQQVRRMTDRDLRQAADSWRRGRIEAPEQIRAWIDSRPEWAADHVATRLSLPVISAEELLRRLGLRLDPRSGTWTQGSSRSAVQDRRRWIAREIRWR